MTRLQTFEALVVKWNPAINLVSKSTVQDVWTRHILDSLDVFNAARRMDQTWLDIGSGGGFPGVVVAILADEYAPDLTVICIESDQRKGEFLRTVARVTEVNFQVVTERIEDAPMQGAEIVSARALTSLPNLLIHTSRHMAPDGIALFPKGETWKEDVEEARKMWHFDLEALPSSTNPKSAILRIGNIQRV